MNPDSGGIMTDLLKNKDSLSIPKNYKWALDNYVTKRGDITCTLRNLGMGDILDNAGCHSVACNNCVWDKRNNAHAETYAAIKRMFDKL